MSSEMNNKRSTNLEVKGNIRSVTKDDISQLLADLMEHFKTNVRQIDRILVGNGWRLKPLEYRDTNNNLIFFRDAIQLSENHKIGLLSMAELLELYCRVLENPTQKEKLLSNIINSVDEVH